MELILNPKPQGPPNLEIYPKLSDGYAYIDVTFDVENDFNIENAKLGHEKSIWKNFIF